MNFDFPNLANAKILVIGDLMLDRYWHGGTDRISPEAPVPVVKVKQNQERPGGAGNVALNIKALGADVAMLGICGADNDGHTLEQKLISAEISCHLQKLTHKPTITKLRILSLHQQLIRLDFEEDLFDVDSDVLVAEAKRLMPNFDVLVLSDYGKGTLKPSRQLISLAKAHNIPILIDPKGADFSKYRGASLLTPNRKEFEMVVGPCRDEHEFIEKGLALIHQLDFSALLVTRGAQGMTLLRPGLPELHLPAKAREVYDVTGAGDTVISVFACALASSGSYEVATVLANCAAGLAVGKLGAATVSVPELRRALQQENASGTGILTEQQLLITVADAKAHQETIVFTNGCFDILHAGHVAYLEQAKRLGHRLIVAVNDDASVAKLKGADRPINSLEQRMAVLAGLSSVDWVVPFSEDTPARLIAAVMPDILVKGGDYQVHEIAGHETVLANGGKVEILNFKPGCSTSAIVEKIQNKEFA